MWQSLRWTRLAWTLLLFFLLPHALGNVTLVQALWEILQDTRSRSHIDDAYLFPCANKIFTVNYKNLNVVGAVDKPIEVCSSSLSPKRTTKSMQASYLREITALYRIGLLVFGFPDFIVNFNSFQPSDGRIRSHLFPQFLMWSVHESTLVTTPTHWIWLVVDDPNL
jgi:hypothetical protein